MFLSKDPWLLIGLIFSILLLAYIGLIWWGVHYKLHKSLRLKVEYRHLENQLFKFDEGFSFRFAYVQLRESAYGAFGGAGLIGQIIIVGIAIIVIAFFGLIVSEFAPSSPITTGVTPFDGAFFETIWQVQATVLTLAFVVAIFLWQSLLEVTPYEGVLKLFIRYSHSIFGVVFSLTSTVVIGFLLMQWYPNGGLNGQFPLFEGFTIIFLSLSTILIILVMYRRAAGLLVYDEDKKLIFQQSRLGLYRKLTPSKRGIERSLRAERLGTNRVLAITAFSQNQITEFTARRLDLSGVITDIELQLLSKTIREIESRNLTVKSVPQIGRNLDEAPDAAMLVIEGDLNQPLANQIEDNLKRAIVTRRGRVVSW